MQRSMGEWHGLRQVAAELLRHLAVCIGAGTAVAGWAAAESRAGRNENWGGQGAIGGQIPI